MENIVFLYPTKIKIMNQNKKNLVDHLLKNGKNSSWEDLAVMFNLATGEVARHTWRNYVLSQELEQIPSSDEVESGNYVAELEDTIVSLMEDLQKGTAEKVFKNPTEIKTLADLIRIGEIDTNVWNIDKVIQNFWAGNYQVKAFLSKKQIEKEPELQKEQILEELKNGSFNNRPTGQFFQMVYNPALDQPIVKNKLLELAIFDLHLGKLSWDKEVGEDYDLDIAVQRYNAAVKSLINNVNINTIERILLPVGNDFINVDYKTNTTTAGTPQSCDSRFGKMLQVAKKLLIDTINMLLTIAPVDVVIVPGNHDEQTMFTLGEILDAWYHTTPDVTIFNSPALRKYYQYGTTSFMFTHGDKEKLNELGMIFAAENPKLWADTQHRFVQIGHFHHNKKVSSLQTQDFQGFQVQIMPSLSGSDAWHHAKGYISQKQAKGFVIDKLRGLVSEHTYTV